MLYDGMAEFVYSAWFLDETARPGDQDREWLACILIDATNAEAAQEWGDTLARDRANRNLGDRFLWSSIEEKTSIIKASNLSDLPRIGEGQHVSDEEIGW